MKKLLYILVTCLLLGGTACRKYVEIPAELVRELKYTADYQALLYNSTMMDASYIYPLFAGDDVGSEEVAWQNNISSLANPAYGKAYTWSDKLFTSTEEDGDWSKLYAQARTCNIIINEVMKSERGTDAQKNTAWASALVHRAYIYYTLVNMYARQYDAATAGIDPGVPLLLENKLFVDLTRASVQAVYNQVVADLNAALPLLPGVPPDVVSNPSKSAAYALLARTYLQMRNFTEAERFADSTLKLKSTLLDLNTYASSTAGFPLKLADPENIFSKTTSARPLGVPISSETLALLGTKDLRYTVLTAPGTSFGSTVLFTTRGYYRPQINGDGFLVGPNVPEMMLIKAECEARANNAGTAIGLLNTLRKKRFTPADYTDLPVTTGPAALALVINERRLELMARGFRWFDQRRLSKDAGLVATVTRNFKGTVYTLEPGSNRYVFPIGDKYILMNPEIAQNPR